MNKTSTRLAHISATLIAAFALVACGGGGGGSPSAVAPAPAPAPTPAPAPAPAPTNPDLVTSVTPPTYAVGSVERGAWDVLMAERQACGFGLLQQDSRLDAANAAHAKYLADLSISQSINWTGHGEDATKPGFTGAGPWDRALAAGFPNNRVAEILNALSTLHATSASDQFAMNEAQGAGSMRSLISTVYHLVGAMTAGRAGGVGSAHASGPFTTPGYSLEVFRFGALIGDPNNNLQKLGTGTIATYPCAAATHASASWAPATESPNSFADVTSTAVFYGTPVYLKVDAPSVLIVTSASIARPDGSLVAARQVTKATDPAGEVGANEFFVVPTAALVVGTTYSVAAAGTVDGVAFVKSFTFTPSP